MKRLLALALLVVAAPAFAQDGDTRRTEGVVWLRTTAPTSTDDLRTGDWWIDTDASPVLAYILTDDDPVTWTLTSTSGSVTTPPTADDQVLVSDSSSAGTWRTLPSCSNAVTSKLLYATATNTWSCGTDQAGGYQTIEDEETPLTQRTTVNFAGAGVNCFDDGIGQTECQIPVGPHNLLDGNVHPDTQVDSATLGRLIYGNGASWETLPGNITTTTKCLTQTGTGAVSAAPTWGACAGAGGGPTRLMMATDVSTTSNTVYSQLTDFSITLDASTNYRIHCRWLTQTAAGTTGLRVRAAGPAVGPGDPSEVIYTRQYYNNNITTYGALLTAGGFHALGSNDTALGSCGTVVCPNDIDIVARIGTAGTLDFYIISEISGSAVTVHGGSYCEWETF